MWLQNKILKITFPLRYYFHLSTYKMFGNIEPIKKLKNKHKGQTMLVIGNGPSLNSTPLHQFASLPAIGMNKIDLIYEETSWRPKYIVSVNNVVINQHQDSFVKSTIPVFLSWKSRYSMSAKNRRNINFFHLNSSSAFSDDPENGFGCSATVTYIALQMAYWMGANPIILFGIDHSFTFTGPAMTYQKREGIDINHFHPDYFPSGLIWGTPDLERSEQEYLIAKKVFEKDNRQILDATIDGKLEVFKKITLDEALQYAKEK